MGTRYTTQILRAVTSTSLGVGSLESVATGRRLCVYEFVFGSDAATLGTSNWRVELTRSTTAGTGGTGNVTPINSLETGLNIGVTRTSLSANGTLVSGNIPISFPLNQQSTYRWLCAPGYEVTISGVNGAGLHILTPVCGNTPSAVAQIYWEE